MDPLSFMRRVEGDGRGGVEIVRATSSASFIYAPLAEDLSALKVSEEAEVCAPDECALDASDWLRGFGEGLRIACPPAVLP